MAEVFDPALFPALVALGQQIRELAGEAAYRAGRDYLRQGMIQEPTVSGTQALAVVRGSTDYRVSISFEGTAAAKVTCSCPAHRRSKHCKHVVAVSVALVEQPRLFRIVAKADIPMVAPPPRKRRDPSAKQKVEELKDQQRQAGLLLVDRLLEELAATGISGLGPEQLALLASVAETVQGLKLRRLGNGLTALRRLVVEHGQEESTPTAFATQLAEISTLRHVVAASLAGEISLDPRLADELIGKTWRAKELEQVTGLELIAIAREVHDDGDFRVESMYLVDLVSNDIFVERQITPRGLRGERLTPRRTRTIVDEAAVYPGLAPRRIKLASTQRGALTMVQIDRVVNAAVGEVAELRRRLIERLSVPVGAAEVAVLFRPEGIVAAGDRLAAIDARGEMVPLVWPDAWSHATVRVMTQESGRYAFVGLVELSSDGPQLRCLSIFGDLGWVNGPHYPELS
jgi:hypothetical protein